MKGRLEGELRGWGSAGVPAITDQRSVGCSRMSDLGHLHAEQNCVWLSPVNAQNPGHMTQDTKFELYAALGD